MPIIGPQMDTKNQDAVKRVSAATTLKPAERVVLITNGTYTINLPPVAECAGNIYTLRQLDAGTDSVTVDDNGDSVDWTNITINAQHDMVALYSDGLMWVVLENRVS